MLHSASPTHAKRVRLAVSLGDPAGIGAEVTLKALAQWPADQPSPLLVGCRRWLKRTYQQLNSCSTAPLADPAALEVLDLPLEQPLAPGQAGAASGHASFQWLSAAVEEVLSGSCSALVTAPIAKHAWHAAGHHYPGQTERLAELCGMAAASMLFTARSPQSGWRLNTLLATTHIPLAAVPQQLSEQLICHKLDVLLAFCERFQPQPRLVVAGLNPHAGEAGQLGREEVDWLIPCLEQWRQRHPQVELIGPLPPDTCWLDAGLAWRGEQARAADGYLALYHDQGLIPVKLLAFDQAVNTSLGLPFLRTSPDHGTGFDIAGRGIARAASMRAALDTALELA
ncbi:MAG: 4-hydroxythreonine-4-phosphate dehydrogenase PdxA [Vulcanococcus sp.]|jgi:4-hydroxythreonine-4-phosphate dehydrogenase|uniref:4-hydroxythreonine-4-phosphate dehydrogenase PdxA n=1 Tax=Vulcanococcus sp. TaxID=2856995 RepID=UPI0025D1123F|nr:4-hydroxythreonine-4-phosphate dehydrogenase PdxA [Vulcanococcus sp.]MBW0173766.1 4-hydroxythreonine-4-phosphate dehydrogenase PdxA [Vulcanococcus sp.]MBW0180992.1 4-hydroxythreonine-4-phosphate dehydrogenase PdxA [Vulcanococcus sp.]